jgi:uncharacterized membrane protein
MNVDRAISYVQAEGDTVQVARLEAALWDEPPSDEALQQLAALQQDDGSFAYWVPQVGNVCDTAYVLQWLDDLKVYRGRLVDPAFHTLLDLQQGDCGWDEVEAVRARHLMQWMILGRIETRVPLPAGWCQWVCRDERRRLWREKVGQHAEFARGEQRRVCGWLSDCLGRKPQHAPGSVFTTLAALVAPAALAPRGELEFGVQAWAAVVGAAVAWRTRNVLATILAGMVTYWLLKAVGF